MYREHILSGFYDDVKPFDCFASLSTIEEYNSSAINLMSDSHVLVVQNQKVGLFCNNGELTLKINYDTIINCWPFIIADNQLFTIVNNSVNLIFEAQDKIVDVNVYSHWISFISGDYRYLFSNRNLLDKVLINENFPAKVITKYWNKRILFSRQGISYEVCSTESEDYYSTDYDRLYRDAYDGDLSNEWNTD